jgi:hypothetical protein
MRFQPRNIEAMVGAFSTSCACGTVVLKISVPRRTSGTHVTCYCKDCRAAAGYSGMRNLHTTPDQGVAIYQTTPDRIEFARGAEQLVIRRLSPNGLFRWYAGCCDTPMFNTLSKPSRPFVGVVIRRDEQADVIDTIGPSVAQVYTAHALEGSGAPEKDSGFFTAGFGIVSRMLGAQLSGRNWRNPLIDTAKIPIAPVQLMDLERVRTLLAE